MATALRSEAEVERLVTDNRKLVEYMVNRYLKRYYVGTMDRADLVSWGMMGLVNAARAWDPNRSRSFSTLACRAIDHLLECIDEPSFGTMIQFNLPDNRLGCANITNAIAVICWTARRRQKHFELGSPQPLG